MGHECFCGGGGAATVTSKNTVPQRGSKYRLVRKAARRKAIANAIEVPGPTTQQRKQFGTMGEIR